MLPRAGSAAAKGRDVAEIVHWVVGVVLEFVKDTFGGHQTGNRGVAGGDPFGHRHHVWLDAVMLISEPRAGSANTANNLVDMQQNIVFVADFLHAIPITLRRSDHATAGCDRFKAQSANGLRAFAQDDFFDLVLRPIRRSFPDRPRLVQSRDTQDSAGHARSLE